MIDFHSHILPALDDGAKNAEESLSLLRLQYEQGADTVVATPHFYPNMVTVDGLIESRQRALHALKEHMGPNPDFKVPRLILGAEVKYYEGISHLDGLERLCIGHTKLLLLEMPFMKWTDYIMRELDKIILARRVQIVLAHIERYLPYGNEANLRKLAEAGVLMQSNASNFIEFSSRRRAIKHLSQGLIHILGSDCHNLKHRPPRLDEAHKRIGKRLGYQFTEDMDDFASSLLSQELSIL